MNNTMNTDNFSERMLKEFPDLFPKDEAGNPTQPSCGFYCPVGWEALVERTIVQLDNLVKNPRQRQTWRVWYLLSSFVCRRMTRPIHARLCRWSSPTEHLYWKDGKRSTYIMMNKERLDPLRAAHPIKTKINDWLKSKWSWITPTYRCKPIICKPVVIEQVKEKFGTLRFYAYGGDARTRAVISFAESMSGLICEETGSTGKLVSRGGWYKTLSPEIAKSSGYK